MKKLYLSLFLLLTVYPLAINAQQVNSKTEFKVSKHVYEFVLNRANLVKIDSNIPEPIAAYYASTVKYIADKNTSLFEKFPYQLFPLLPALSKTQSQKLFDTFELQYFNQLVMFCLLKGIGLTRNMSSAELDQFGLALNSNGQLMLLNYAVFNLLSKNVQSAAMSLMYPYRAKPGLEKQSVTNSINLLKDTMLEWAQQVFGFRGDQQKIKALSDQMAVDLSHWYK